MKSNLISAPVWISCLFSVVIAQDYYNNYVLDAPKSFQSIYERKFAYHDSQEDDGFGKAVSIYGDRMLVGACFNDDRGTQAGSAYVFVLDDSQQGWELESVLYGNDTSEYDYFGWSVSLVDDYALIGAWQDDDKGSESGSAFFFKKVKKGRDGYQWVEIKKVYAKDAESNDFFGLSVAMSADGVALIGSPGRTVNGKTNAGLVTVFRRAQDIWFREDELQAAEPAYNDYFGISVAIYRDTAVVGAYGHDPGPGEETGAAFVYKRDQGTTYWALKSVLVASDAASSDFFGRSVAIWGTTIVVGADGNDDFGSSSGSAYVFDISNSHQWAESQKLLPLKSNEYDYFGVSISMWNNSLVIGADGTTHDGGKLTGSAWYFERGRNGRWKAILQINASDNNPYDLYGSSVSIHKTSILIGAEMGNGYRYDTGAAYAYTKIPSPRRSVASAFISAGVYVLITISAVLPLVGLAWWAYHTKSFSFQNLDAGSGGIDDSRTALTSGFWVS